MKRNGYILAIVASTIYLLNPGWGVFELIPDNLPFIGNIDEGAAGALILWAIGRLRSEKKTDTQ